MKKTFLCLVAALVILLGSFVVSEATPVITQENIKDGLDFCKDYPVTLMLDGETIAFSESDVPPVIITPEGEENGRTLIPARALFEKAGAVVTWINESQTVIIEHGQFVIELVIGSNIALVNDEEKVLDVPAFIIDHDGDYYGSTMIPVRFVAENLSFGVEWDDVSRTVKVSSPVIEPNRGDVDRPPISTGSAVDVTTDPAIGEATDSAIETNPGYEVIEGVLFPSYDMTTMPALNEAAKGILITVDAGHGGRDSGSIGHSKQPDELYEKDVNLAVALRAIELLEEAGFEVYATRTDDSYIYYKTRAYDSNDAGAYFLVSYHNNSINDPSIKGSLVCYYSKSTEAGYKVNSKSIASAVQSEMVKALGTEDRGISNKKELAVLNKSVMPAIIIEGAFISNEEDFAKMKTQEYAERYAWASVKAIIESFNAAFPDEEI